MKLFYFLFLMVLMTYNVHAQLSDNSRTVSGKTIAKNDDPTMTISNSIISTVNKTSITTNLLPNKSGTFAMLDDIPESSSGAGLTNINQVISVQTITPGTNVIIDAASYNTLDLILTNNVVLEVPTNFVNGTRLTWRLYSYQTNRNVYLPTNSFVLPLESSMSNTFTVASNKVALLVTQYFVNSYRTNWLITSFVGGY